MDATAAVVWLGSSLELMADLDEQLRKQAEKHGLAAYDPSQSEGERLKERYYQEEREDHILEVEFENGGFAGFRKASGGDEEDPKMSLEEYSSSEDLEKLDMSILKV